MSGVRVRIYEIVQRIPLQQSNFPKGEETFEYSVCLRGRFPSVDHRVSKWEYPLVVDGSQEA